MNYIVDDIGTVVSAIRERWVSADNTEITADSDILTADGGSAPYYAYGHRLEIARGLMQKNKDKSHKFRKYPLIALRMDIPEVIDNGVISYRLNIGIFHFTNKNYTAAQRYVNVFKPTLYPLYIMFMEELKKSGLFMWSGNQYMPPHTKIDRPFWGTAGGEKNDRYIFEDPLDAIELVDLRVNSLIKNC